MKPAVTLEVLYPYPPHHVWRALVDSRALARWLMPNTFRPVLGHRFQFLNDSPDHSPEVIECEVTEIEPPLRLSYTWRVPDSHELTIVTWVLEPAAGGTRLRLSHRAAADSAAAPHAGAADDAAAHAWNHRLGQLKDALSAPLEAIALFRMTQRPWPMTSSSGGARASSPPAA